MKRGIVHHDHMIIMQDRTEALFQPLIENMRSTRTLPQLCGLQDPIELYLKVVHEVS